MNPSIKSKLPAAGTTIFTVMSSLALEHNAINLGQGFPDYPMNKELIELVNKSMRNGNNQYVHMCGLPNLRKTLSEKISCLYDAVINPETEITITPGGTYAIYTALTTILEAGDEVIVFEPAYDSYIPNILLNGAIPICISLEYPGYHINWEIVKQKITPKTKLIMINSPHNPTGSVLTKQDIKQLESIVKGTGIFILSDEVYEHIIFDGITHESMLKYPTIYERSFVCFSFGKVYHCTGWKLGYCVAPPMLMKEFRKVHQFNCFTCNSPIQFALNEFLKKKEPYLRLGKFLQTKRDYFLKRMQETRFTPIVSHGSYFQLYSYEGITDEKESDFAIRLTREFGVVTIPVSAFYKNTLENKVLRFCFAKKENTLDEAVNRLIKV